MQNQVVSEVPLDSEWVELILMAKNIGLTPSDIHKFLKGQSVECKDPQQKW